MTPGEVVLFRGGPGIDMKDSLLTYGLGGMLVGTVPLILAGVSLAGFSAWIPGFYTWVMPACICLAAVGVLLLLSLTVAAYSIRTEVTVTRRSYGMLTFDARQELFGFTVARKSTHVLADTVAIGFDYRQEDTSPKHLWEVVVTNGYGDLVPLDTGHLKVEPAEASRGQAMGRLTQLGIRVDVSEPVPLPQPEPDDDEDE